LRWSRAHEWCTG